MTKIQKRVVAFASVFALCWLTAPGAGAMHIMEGYLPVAHSLGWSVMCVPFLAAGLFSIQKIVSRKRSTLLLLAMAGAYTFVLSALKIPSVTGSSSHPTGTGLGAILFGPAPMAVLGIIVLLFQAVLLAHGGLTTLGANTFSMAIAGPFVSFGVYRLCRALKVNKLAAVFLAACLGDLFTYCVTSFQLALAYPGEGFGQSLLLFMSVFSLTQIPLAIIEGLLTAVVVLGLEAWAKPELRDLGYLEGA